MIIEILDKQYEAEEDYEPIFVDGRKYIPIKVYFKNSELKDMILAVDVKTGHKECFHRMDIGRELKEKKTAQFVEWTYDEIKVMQEAIKNKFSTAEITKLVELNRHTELAIRNKVMLVKQKMIYKKEFDMKSKPRFNIKF